MDLLNPPRPPRADAPKTRQMKAIRKKPQDDIETYELPKVRLEPVPPSFRPEIYVKNGDAARHLLKNPHIVIKKFNPRDSIMVVDINGTAQTRKIGTRITPLKNYVDVHAAGAMRQVYEDRKAGIAAAIGKDYLLESDEINQGEASALAKGF